MITKQFVSIYCVVNDHLDYIILCNYFSCILFGWTIKGYRNGIFEKNKLRNSFPGQSPTRSDKKTISLWSFSYKLPIKYLFMYISKDGVTLHVLKTHVTFIHIDRTNNLCMKSDRDTEQFHFFYSPAGACQIAKSPAQ